MPQRTNDFQALIALIERQLAAEGVVVTESEMLADRLTGERREVDVCIRATINRKPVVFALECRDHKRKADRVWVDGLIGKYRDLPVDAVFAVARAGFSKAAVKAAEAAGIQCLTLEQATAANWHLIAKLPEDVQTVHHMPVVADLCFHLVKGQAPIAEDLPAGKAVLHIAGVPCPLTDVVDDFCGGQQLAQIAFSGDELKGARVFLNAQPGTLLEWPSGERRALESIELLVVFERHSEMTKFERRVYGDTGVAFANKTYTRDGQTAHFTLSMVQQGSEASIGASVRMPDGRTGFVVSPKGSPDGPLEGSG